MQWCSYCEKGDHSDVDCWSTRPADWKPGFVPVSFDSVARLIAERNEASQRDPFMPPHTGLDAVLDRYSPKPIG
jgi:hypothetical protein